MPGEIGIELTDELFAFCGLGIYLVSCRFCQRLEALLGLLFEVEGVESFGRAFGFGDGYIAFLLDLLC